MSRKEDIVTYVLYRLGGAGGSVHIEHIAAKSYELAPDQFSWQLEKYKKYPDIKAVYYALDSVSRGGVDHLVQKIADRSKGGQRYQLTRTGVQWIKENERRMVAEFGGDRKKAENPNKEVQKFLDNVKKRDSAFKRYKKDGENVVFSIYELTDFLGCSLSVSPSEVRSKFTEMQVKAELVEDAEINAFLSIAKAKFPNILKREGAS